MNIYYTYAYLREDGTPYYIGRGKGRRLSERHLRRSGKFVPVPPKNRIRILKKDLTYEESLKHEVYMIFLFGRKDLGSGILINMSDGGEGNKGHRHTPETKQKMSSKRRGKSRSPEWRRKISEAHKGIGHTEETKDKLSKIHKGKLWWVNPSGQTSFAFSPPDDSFIRGRKYKWS